MTGDVLHQPVAHIELLELVTGIYNDFLRFIALQYIVGEMVTEGAGSAGNQNCFIVQHRKLPASIFSIKSSC